MVKTEIRLWYFCGQTRNCRSFHCGNFHFGGPEGDRTLETSWMRTVRSRDADAVLVRPDMFEDDVQRSFAEVEVGTNPCGDGNSSGVKYIFDHPLCEFPRGQDGSLKIEGDIHEHLVDGIGVDVFRRHMAEVCLIYAGAPLHVTGHAI